MKPSSYQAVKLNLWPLRLSFALLPASVQDPIHLVLDIFLEHLYISTFPATSEMPEVVDPIDIPNQLRWTNPLGELGTGDFE